VQQVTLAIKLFHAGRFTTFLRQFSDWDGNEFFGEKEFNHSPEAQYRLGWNLTDWPWEWTVTVDASRKNYILMETSMAYRVENIQPQLVSMMLELRAFGEVLKESDSKLLDLDDVYSMFNK
jgi:hypothetical protein